MQDLLPRTHNGLRRMVSHIHDSILVQLLFVAKRKSAHKIVSSFQMTNQTIVQVISLVYLFFCGVVSAQVTLTATVRDDVNGNGVTDDSDNTVQGMLCRLRNAAGTVVAADFTKETGQCSFDDVASLGGFPVVLALMAPRGKVFVIPNGGILELTEMDVIRNSISTLVLLREEEKCEGALECIAYYVLFGWVLDLAGVWKPYLE